MVSDQSYSHRVIPIFVSFPVVPSWVLSIANLVSDVEATGEKCPTWYHRGDSLIQSFDCYDFEASYSSANHQFHQRNYEFHRSTMIRTIVWMMIMALHSIRSVVLDDVVVIRYFVTEELFDYWLIASVEAVMMSLSPS